MKRFYEKPSSATLGIFILRVALAYDLFSSAQLFITATHWRMPIEALAVTLFIFLLGGILFAIGFLTRIMGIVAALYFLIEVHSYGASGGTWFEIVVPLVLFITGAGKFSLDWKVFGKEGNQEAQLQKTSSQ